MKQGHGADPHEDFAKVYGKLRRGDWWGLT